MIPVINMAKTARNLREKKREMRLTAEEIAEQAHVTTQSVYRWTSGQAVPTIDNLVILAQMFDCLIDDLIITEEI